jgi:hypothetical protein
MRPPGGETLGTVPRDRAYARYALGVTSASRACLFGKFGNGIQFTWYIKSRPARRT